jgi:spermidine synthase
MGGVSEIGHSVSERGEIVLRRREDGALELRVNGVFVMDDRETRSEELLATAALDGLERPGRILVGGLGLGYTVRALLADGRARQVLVAEIEPELVQWMRAGLLPSVLDDSRVEVRVGDVRHIVNEQPNGSLDEILLDVDNGPDFLNDCRRKLRPGGTLTVWSSSDSKPLKEAVSHTFGSCTVKAVPVNLQGRDETYYVYRARSPTRP